MDKKETIAAVRRLYLSGEVAAVNVYSRLEHVLSAAEITIKLREWDQVRGLADELGQPIPSGDGDGDRERDLYALHREARRQDAAYRHGPRPRAAGLDQAPDPRRQLAASAEREAAAILAGAGLDVDLTPGHNDRHDLTVNGCLRCEVKASRWTGAQNATGRYQCLFHNDADLLLWLLADVGQWVIVPSGELGDRRNLAIWSHDPAEYTGQWAAYLGAWDIVDQALATAIATGRTLAQVAF